MFDPHDDYRSIANNGDNMTDMERIGKRDFIREVAHRAGFTITDTKIIWESVMEVIIDNLLEENSTALEGLCVIEPHTIKPYTGYNRFTKKKMEVPEGIRIVFRPSKTLLRLLKEQREAREI